MFPLLEGGGETDGANGIIAVVEDVVDMRGVADEVSDFTLEGGDIGTVLVIENMGFEVLLLYRMDA